MIFQNETRRFRTEVCSKKETVRKRNCREGKQSGKGKLCGKETFRKRKLSGKENYTEKKSVWEKKLYGKEGFS